MSPEAQKDEFRRKAAEAVGSLSAATRRAHEERILQLLRDSPQYDGAEQVFAYNALADEVSLEALLHRSGEDGKALFLPVVDPADWSMKFRNWSPTEPVRSGPGGVVEPRAGQGPTTAASVILVPGRAFDARGGRVGRGRGCYDRAMHDLESLGPTVGVAYACQLFEGLPCEAHDMRVRFLLTEEGFVETGSDRS